MPLLPDQITANNFKDFYDKIKPYLNYQPTMGFTPVGTVISIMGTHAPAHYLICDGTVYNIADHLELANYFADQFGSANFFGGDGTTTFAVPDLRGEFLRGTGTNSHSNQGDGANVGVHQDGTLHSFSTSTANIYGATSLGSISLNEDHSGQVGTTRRRVSAETENNPMSVYTSRPTNTSVLYCIAEKNIFIQVLGGGGGTGDMSTADYAKLGVTDTVDKAVSLYDGTDALTSTIPELNKLHGATVTTSELNKLHGTSVTTSELNYVHGVTGNIQTQLNSKSAVSWTQSVSTGTKIATVNIDGTPTDVYAPSGSSGTTDYNALSNQPQINGNILTGNKTSAQLGISNRTIKDDGTAMADQSAVNFTDFDMENNTSDHQTEIKAHELTSAEVTEILADLPNGAVNMMPVLFDESGAERAVGWYKLADGTKKPVYQKTVDFGALPAAEGTKNVSHNVANIDSFIKVDGIVSNGTSWFNLVWSSGLYSNTTVNLMRLLATDTEITIINSSKINANTWVCSVTIQYTKTTDTPI